MVHNVDLNSRDDILLLASQFIRIMASRVLFRRRAVAPLATAVLGGIALAPATAWAEGHNDLKRKPIYDDVEITPPSINTSLPKVVPGTASPSEGSTPPKPPGPTPTDRLAVQIGNARIFLYRYAVVAEDKLNDTVDSAFDLEESFTKTIASLAPPRESGEKLMPGSIYVLVSAMAGSILTRNRNIVLRATVPLVLGIGAGWVVVPITMGNIAELAWRYEKKFPAVADTHLAVRDYIEKGFSFAKVHKDIGARMVSDKVTDMRETVESWVKEGK